MRSAQRDLDTNTKQTHAITKVTRIQDAKNKIVHTKTGMTRHKTRIRSRNKSTLRYTTNRQRTHTHTHTHTHIRTGGRRHERLRRLQEVAPAVSRAVWLLPAALVLLYACIMCPNSYEHESVGCMLMHTWPQA